MVCVESAASCSIVNDPRDGSSLLAIRSLLWRILARREAIMNSSASFGLIVGGVILCVAYVAPSPWGPALLFIPMGIWILAGAVLSWRKTRLRFRSIAMIFMASAAFVIGFLALAGHSFPIIPRLWMVIFGSLVALGLAAFLLEGVKNGVKVRELRQWGNRCSVIDIFLFRDIPDWRASRDSQSKRGP